MQRHKNAGDDGLIVVADTDEASFEEPVAQVGFDKKLAVLEEAILKHPLNREVLYTILAQCATERTLSDIEDFISALPAFKSATQNQCHLIETLEKSYGLKCIEHDVSGAPIDPFSKSAMTLDEIDDLVQGWSYVTTDVGLRFVELHEPKARMRELFGLIPERKDTYEALLTYISEAPRSYGDVCRLLQKSPALETMVDGKRIVMQPSVFLDKLERSGALIWNGGWNLTGGGREYLGELSR